MDNLLHNIRYDILGDIYNPLRQLPGQGDAPDQALQICGGHVANLKILNLSCCVGEDCEFLMRRGAKSVTGIDRDLELVYEARRRLPENMSVEYHVGNCTEPNLLFSIGLEPGSYDLVIAPWVLSQASDRNALRNLFRNISSALKPGGRLVGSAVSGSLVSEYEQGKLFINESGLGSFAGGYETKWEAAEQVYGGYKMRLVSYREGDIPPIHFDCFSLSTAMYDSAARAATLQSISWTWGLWTGIYTATKRKSKLDTDDEKQPDSSVYSVDE